MGPIGRYSLMLETKIISKLFEFCIIKWVAIVRFNCSGSSVTSKDFVKIGNNSCMGYCSNNVYFGISWVVLNQYNKYLPLGNGPQKSIDTLSPGFLLASGIHKGSMLLLFVVIWQAKQQLTFSSTCLSMVGNQTFSRKSCFVHDTCMS